MTCKVIFLEAWFLTDSIEVRRFRRYLNLASWYEFKLRISIGEYSKYILIISSHSFGYLSHYRSLKTPIVDQRNTLDH